MQPKPGRSARNGDLAWPALLRKLDRDRSVLSELSFVRQDGYRSVRKNSRTSPTNKSGCSNAAKWPPFGISLQCRIFV